MDPDKIIHLTLVHGTFNPSAAWTKDGSFLRRRLIEIFGDQVQFHNEFTWSGCPTHTARHLAAKRLKAFLTSLTRRYPGRHVVIGHSHGAMVALYALRDGELEGKIEGLVTLSTPFLTARRRDLSLLGIFSAILGSIATFMLCLISPLREWFDRTLALPRLNRSRVLIIRTPSDEAGAFITLFHAVDLAVNAVWARRGPFDQFTKAALRSLLVKINDAIPDAVTEGIRVWIFVGALPWIILMLAISLPLAHAGRTDVFSYLSQLGGWHLWTIVLLGILASLHIVIFILFISILTAILVAGFPFAVLMLGAILSTIILAAFITVPELGPCAVVLSISAEATPPGRFDVFQLKGDEPGFLLHSLAYDSPEALPVIGAWIQELGSANGPLIIIEPPKQPIPMGD